MEYSARSLHVTLVTPFEASGAVDTAGLAKLAQRMTAIDSPIPMIPIVNAEAGEIYTLTRDELVTNLQAVRDAVDTPIVAGVVGRTSGEAIEIAQDALRAGASGLFVLPPYGSADITTSWDAARYPEVVVDYLHRIASAVGEVPLLIHPTGRANPPYGIGWPPATVRAVLDRVPTVRGWKMTYSYEGYRQVARMIHEEYPHVAVLPSSAVRYHENLANDQLDGACSGSFCYALDPMIEHLRLWSQGDVPAATKLWHAGLAELHEYVYSDYSRLHIRYKLASWLAGEIESPLMRDPMPAPTADEAERLQSLLVAAGIESRDAAELKAAVAGRAV